MSLNFGFSMLQQLCKLELVPLSPRRQPWSSPCAQRSLHHRAQHGSSPRAVEKLDFEFWILKLNIRLASSQCSKLMFVGERANGACLGVGKAEDGSHTLKPALARVTEY